MNEPPEEQIIAGRIAKGAIALAQDLCRWPLEGEQLDLEIEQYIRDEGGEPALKGYHPRFADRPYQWTICLGVDNDVVHGVPHKPLDPNNIITVDLVVKFGEYYADTARTFTYSTNESRKSFVNISKQIFDISKTGVIPGQPISLFGEAVERSAGIVKYGVVKEYCGHGIGKDIHCPPQIPNYYSPIAGQFKVGQSYAVEPVLAINPIYQLEHHDDGYSVTADCLVSHNEDTIFIGERGAVNLTGD